MANIHNARLRAVTGMVIAGSAFFPAAAMGRGLEPPQESGRTATREDEIVVTARRAAESQQDVPIAITTVTAELLKDNNVRDVRDLPRLAPGLTITTNNLSGRVRLTIRGQAEADDKLTADRSVGVYIDGVSFEHSYGLTASLIDLEQVEVLRGPQGTLFGRNTTGGALNVTTRRPDYERGGYVDLQYGSYDNIQALAAVNLPVVDDRLAVRLVGQVISRDGYFPAFDGHRTDNDHSWTGRLLVRADLVDDVSVLLSADYVQMRNSDIHAALTSDQMLASQNTATRSLGAIASQLGLNPALPADRMTAYNRWRQYYDAYRANDRAGFGNAYLPKDDLDRYALSANIDIAFGGVTLKSITAYRHLWRLYHAELDGTPFDLFMNRQSTRSDFFSQEFQLAAMDGRGLDWQAGVFYHHETGDEYSAGDTLIYVNASRAGLTDFGVVNSSRAAYAQAIYHAGPALRLTGGIRYTRDDRQIDVRNRVDTSVAILPLPPGGVSRCADVPVALGGGAFPNCRYSADTGFEKLTWLASADWRPTADLMLYGTVSTGYRSGGFTPPGTGTFPTLADRNAALTPYLPETVTNYELGVKADLLDRRLRINVSLYYQDYSNIQKSIRDIVNGVLVQITRNAAKARLYGGEFEVTARPVDGLSLNARAAYLNARYGEFITLDAAGNRLDLTAQPFVAPEWTFGLSAKYVAPLPDGSLSFAANFAWTDTVNYFPTAADAASVTQPAYGLLDARIEWHVGSAGLDLAVFGKNLTDKHYFVSASSLESLGFNVGYSAPPRTFGVQLRKSF